MKKMDVIVNELHMSAKIDKNLQFYSRHRRHDDDTETSPWNNELKYTVQ